MIAEHGEERNGTPLGLVDWTGIGDLSGSRSIETQEVTVGSYEVGANPINRGRAFESVPIEVVAEQNESIDGLPLRFEGHLSRYRELTFEEFGEGAMAARISRDEQGPMGCS
jgi:hypothetical protein